MPRCSRRSRLCLPSARSLACSRSLLEGERQRANQIRERYAARRCIKLRRRLRWPAAQAQVGERQPQRSRGAHW